MDREQISTINIILQSHSSFFKKSIKTLVQKLASDKGFCWILKYKMKIYWTISPFSFGLLNKMSMAFCPQLTCSNQYTHYFKAKALNIIAVIFIFWHCMTLWKSIVHIYSLGTTNTVYTRHIIGMRVPKPQMITQAND